MPRSSDRPFGVEVTRGNWVESRHAVDVAVCDSDGAIHTRFGTADSMVFPRSAIKAFQALPLIESGAADHYGFSPAQIALACASHNGEPVHVETASAMLAAAGLEVQCLECGPQYPERDADRNALAAAGIGPQPVHNNCSGKHAGFLAFARHVNLPVPGYVEYGSPVQKVIAQTLEEVTRASHGADNYGIDGCSIPTWAIPLQSLAAAFARFSVDQADSGLRSRAMKRIRESCMAHPQMVAGTGRMDTDLMAGFSNRLFCKIGAEGVYTAAIPELGLGLALKARDGSQRAVETALAVVLESLLELEESERKLLNRFTHQVLKNRRNIPVGAVRPAIR